MKSFSILWPIICGLTNRIRGGWLMNYIKKFIPFWSTTPARLFVSGIISVPVWLTQGIETALLFWILLYVGFIFRWSPWNFMAKPAHDIMCLTVRGAVLTFPAGYVCDLDIFAPCGLLMGVVYYLSYQLPFQHQDPDGYVWIGSDWGELFFGILLGIFICFNCM